MKTCVIAMLSCLIGLSVGCTPERAMNSRLSGLLKANNFVLYTPFRGDDYPGTVFVLNQNEKGRWTEFTLSRWSQTFDERVSFGDLFKPQDAPILDKLSTKFSLDAGVGAEVASMFVDASASAKYVREITIEFTDPRVRYVMSDADLAKARYFLSKPARDAIQFYKDRGELDRTYLVMEVLEVGHLKAKISLQTGLGAKVGLSKIAGELVKASANVDSSSGDELEVSSKGAVLIGYKARKVPDTILSTQVAADEALKGAIVPARELIRIKSQ